MAVKIYLPDGGSITIRVDRATRIQVVASGGVRIDIGDGPGDRVSITAGSRARDGGGAMTDSRRIAGRGAVTPAMEKAAVEAFLGGADVTRLGRSLGEVYASMDAVRRSEEGQDED